MCIKLYVSEQNRDVWNISFQPVECINATDMSTLHQQGPLDAGASAAHPGTLTGTGRKQCDVTVRCLADMGITPGVMLRIQAMEIDPKDICVKLIFFHSYKFVFHI